MTTFDSNLLKKWFLREKRELPWRQNPNPYSIWVSEVMLQQTRVSVVIPYFERWMTLFPTIEALARSPLDKVIKAWEGLGYYSRARNLHEGARYVLEHYNGKLPEHEDDLKKIKGLGPYTIGAIRSFAFKQKAPAVDGNVIRVLSRFFLVEEDTSKPKTIKKLWELASSILPEEEPWIVNEALIELGATLCARKPKCSDCPLRKGCKAYEQGLAEKIPFKSAKVKTEHLHRAVAVVIADGKLLVRRGKKGEIMSDLHEFPYIKCSTNRIDGLDFTKKIRREFGLTVALEKELKETAHSFTRYQVQLFPALFYCKKSVEIPGYQWLSLSELDSLAFSSGHRRIFEENREYIAICSTS